MTKFDCRVVDYLLKPQSNVRTSRHGAAIAILVVYFLLLFLMTLTYFRLLYVVIFNPGYVPRGPQWQAQQNKRKREKAGIEEKADGSSSSSSDTVTGVVYSPPNGRAGPPTTESAPGLQDFFSRNLYVCQGDGRPIWCSTCQNWKPDRAHHCREVDRCVRKMDHFCPWVGGVVSETSFKFFIQFTAWTSLFCLFVLIIMAIFLAEMNRNTGFINVHWIVTIALAGLFFLFTLGMTGSSVQFALLNTTTIENLSRKTIVWDLAIHIPKHPQQPPAFPAISFSTGQATIPSEYTDQSMPPNAIKTFAILHSKPGESPFDLGAFRNFKSVMGERWYDWLLPFKYSPCCDHSSEECQFEVGAGVARMRKEAGIASPEDVNGSGQKGRRQRSRHKRQRIKRTPRGDTPTGEGDRLGEDQPEEKEERDVADIV